MVFTSPAFLFAFLPLVLALAFVLPKPLRNGWLLVASIAFYAWGEKLFAGVMLLSVLVNWLLGLALERCREEGYRASVVAVAVVANIGLLGFCKYAGFLVENLNILLAGMALPPVRFEPMHLPLGISFFTFHALSYVIDIYRRTARAQRNPVDFALYIAFFPQLIAGPIVRYHDIDTQLSSRRVTLNGFAMGCERFTVGLAKKMVIANPLGAVADTIFNLPTDQIGAPTAWLGILCYTAQIYFDFSGYSDMAIGLARMFGFSFLENFNYPYIARSMQDFWRRWHISLSNWFRDYLYIPLGGNRVSRLRTYANLIFVFFVCGLWHGASWNFVIWGMIHGTFLALERGPFGRVVHGLPAWARHLYVMAVVMVAWVFFRSASLDHALSYLGAMAGLSVDNGHWPVAMFLDTQAQVLLVAAAIGATPLLSRLTADWAARARQSQGRIEPPFETLSFAKDAGWLLALRLTVLLGGLVMAAAAIAAGTYNPFIYFRF
ncbi:membrane bound O-acyl transferase [Azospirillum sp. B510]|uniref:MBOAT family O-acyltransferase n=1 Tax=Azospirillum sp. (strain B510) TaxID=137722 RepID=UPI0001C4C430|nr:MBOAT family protein [Azospirillum sp. B510]BAI72635.1 membrane bound O-acyl transferase [Azospirillum sp. B510]